jgi:hypothetical protein
MSEYHVFLPQLEVKAVAASPHCHIVKNDFGIRGALPYFADTEMYSKSATARFRSAEIIYSDDPASKDCVGGLFTASNGAPKVVTRHTRVLARRNAATVFEPMRLQ